MHTFGRPYGPFVVQSIGLVALLVAFVKARAYLDWLDKTIFSFHKLESTINEEGNRTVIFFHFGNDLCIRHIYHCLCSVH